MANRPHKGLTDLFVKNTREIVGRRARGIEPPERFNGMIQTMLFNLHHHLQREGSNLEDIKTHTRVPGNTAWIKNLAEIRSHYNSLHTTYEQIVDEEDAIYRIERKSHMTALIFRFLTTLGIGFGVLIVYWIASMFEIAMPLMRVI